MSATTHMLKAVVATNAPMNKYLFNLVEPH
jgi:hypothetical protein